MLVNWLWSGCKTAATVALLIAVIGLVILFFFAAPIAVLAETLDIIAMDSQAIGVVTDVNIVRGKKRTSAVRVTYKFVADDVQLESRRMYPGFLGNRGTFSGGAGLKDEYAVGMPCTVYYDSALPSRCALKYGWFQWSVGFAAAVWGAVLASYCRANQSPLTIVAWGLLVYGIGLIFAGPTVVDVREAHWHILAYICILVPVAAFYLYGQKLSERWVEREQRI